MTDRLIQQALLQVLQPILDPTFSEHSYGFQPGRRVVVDVDLEKFFDQVNHDILIDRLRKRIGDARILRLIRAYLNSGIMSGGVVQERHQLRAIQLKHLKRGTTMFGNYAHSEHRMA